MSKLLPTVSTGGDRRTLTTQDVPRRAPGGARVVPRRQVRDVHPLGRVQPARPGRVGDAEPRRSRSTTYEWLASTFNPVKFDAREWVALAKAAGMRYITITSRHHDGFSMFATKATPLQHRGLDAVQARSAEGAGGRVPPAGHQALLLLLAARLASSRLLPARRHRHEHRPAGERRLERAISTSWMRSSPSCSRTTARSAASGSTACGTSPTPTGGSIATYALIHRLQPAALIVPNHHKAPLPGEDVQTFEQDLPGANTAGFNTKEIGALPLETSLTMNGSWGFNITDRNFKSLRELIGYLVRAAGNGANLLLNIGPRPDGTIQPEAVERLQEIGRGCRRTARRSTARARGPIAAAAVGRDDAARRHGVRARARRRITLLSLPSIGARVTRATSLAEPAGRDRALRCRRSCSRDRLRRTSRSASSALETVR